MLKYVFAFLGVFSCMQAHSQEMCVTVDRDKGTYTVTQDGCVPSIPMPNGR